MRLVKSKNYNINYLAKIVDITTFHQHPDPEVTKLKCAYVDGYNVIVGIDEQPNKFIYFPTSSQINPDFLSFANLYRHSEKNANPEKSGYFNDNGRVTAIKLRGCVSEGFLIPVQIFNNWLLDSIQIGLDEYENGLEFDTIEHNGKSFWVCKKYVVHSYQKREYRSGKVRKTKSYDRVIPEQFPEHYETQQIRRISNPIQPNDIIQLSYKIHGTSLRTGWVLCNNKPTFWQSCLNLLQGKKWNEPIKTYDYLYGSRRVVKSETNNSGYYKSEPYEAAFNVLKPALQKGMMIYAEIVGFNPDGSYIQKDYDYGCVPPVNNEYVSEKNFKVRPYRITIVNVDGQIHEFSPREVQIYCKTHNLIPVTECYYGYANDLYPSIKIEDLPELSVDNWYNYFLEKLSNDKDFYMECNSPDCNNKVPHEGLVIKIDNMHSFAMKLKCWKFLGKEQQALDAGEINIEDEN